MTSLPRRPWAQWSGQVSDLKGFFFFGPSSGAEPLSGWRAHSLPRLASAYTCASIPRTSSHPTHGHPSLYSSGAVSAWSCSPTSCIYSRSRLISTAALTSAFTAAERYDSQNARIAAWASAMVFGRLSMKAAVGWGMAGTLSQPPRRVSSLGRGKNLSAGRAMPRGLAPAGRRARR